MPARLRIPPNRALLRYPVSILVIKASENYCCNRQCNQVQNASLESDPVARQPARTGGGHQKAKPEFKVWQRHPAETSVRLAKDFVLSVSNALRYIRFQNLFPTRYCFRRISKRICRHSHHRCILIQLLHINLIKSVCGRMMIVKVEPRILRGRETGNP